MLVLRHQKSASCYRFWMMFVHVKTVYLRYEKVVRLEF